MVKMVKKFRDGRGVAQVSTDKSLCRTPDFFS